MELNKVTQKYEIDRFLGRVYAFESLDLILEINADTRCPEGHSTHVHEPNERYWRSLFCGYPDRVILYNTLFTILFVSGGLLDILLTCDLRHTFLCRIWLHQQQQKLPSRLPSPLTQSCRSR